MIQIKKAKLTKETEALVFKFRLRLPLWGKNKHAVVIMRECNKVLSASMIGRILKKLIAAHNIKPVVFYYGKLSKKPGLFNAHAKRCQYGMESTCPRELVEIDHMTV